MRTTKSAAGVPMPEVLQRFRLRDWAHLVGPEPDHWGGGMTGVTWGCFKARSLFLQARAEWRRASLTEARPPAPAIDHDRNELLLEPTPRNS